MSMKIERPEAETREGILFFGRINPAGYQKRLLELFMDGEKQPVRMVILIDEDYGSADTRIDLAFQEWVKEGLFWKTVTDEKNIAILETARQERLDDVEWFKRTHRFVNLEGSRDTFILTTDKSDLSPRIKRVMEIGEEAVKLEEAEVHKIWIAEQEAHVLNEMPNDPGIQAAVQKAVEEKQRVILVVKGFRPMFVPLAEHGYNYFWLPSHEASRENSYGCVPVPVVCRICGVDPQAVQDAYFGTPKRSFEEVTQAVTDILPFAEIEWKRESGSTGEIYTLLITRKKELYEIVKQP